ncbi:MAG: DNA-3-methyladenine glycosylase [Gemmatimonadaceae bacterium]|nr:DNA-3-methyladenine glycosylase [Chitinophagaceae bacterium]
MEKLGAAFYERKDVIAIARELLGKLIVTTFAGECTVGRIVEVEAYNGVVDKASHAYAGRRTKRTEIMFGRAGTAYVYLCYGIHHLFNVVTNQPDIPHAVLVRAIEPVEGIDIMMERMNREKADHTIGRGPGNVSKALGINTAHTGMSLLDDNIFIASDGYKLKKEDIVESQRIGVAYAAEDALLPYRFSIKGNPCVSGKKVRD